MSSKKIKTISPLATPNKPQRHRLPNFQFPNGIDDSVDNTRFRTSQEEDIEDSDGEDVTKRTRSKEKLSARLRETPSPTDHSSSNIKVEHPSNTVAYNTNEVNAPRNYIDNIILDPLHFLLANNQVEMLDEIQYVSRETLRQLSNGPNSIQSKRESAHRMVDHFFNSMEARLASRKEHEIRQITNKYKRDLAELGVDVADVDSFLVTRDDNFNEDGKL